MKFRYGYRTKENEKVEGIISASSREDVYARLKREGRKPYMVEPLPGLWNRIQGFGKRWAAILILTIVVAILLAVLVRDDRNAEEVGAFDAPMRRQVIGDAAIIEQGIRDGWAAVFAEEGERFLASFAVPGVPAGLRNTKEVEIRESLGRKILASADDSIEARQIKSMVEGMKQELRQFLADGGTIAQYGRRLVLRQEEEISYYNRAKTELDTAIREKKGDAVIADLVERYNENLRKIGVRPLVVSGTAE